MLLSDESSGFLKICKIEKQTRRRGSAFSSSYLEAVDQSWK